MRRTLALVSTASALALGAAACGSSSTPAATTSSTSSSSSSSSSSMATTSDTMSPSATADAAAKDIVDTAVGAGDFKTLATALTAAGLVDTLKGPGPFTVFAPTDAAFAKLPPTTIPTLLKDPKGKLTTILTYHVVPGKVMAADVVKLNGQTVKTVQGGTLTVKVNGSNVALVDGAGNSVNVTKTDIPASNGVIHVLDGVLMPTK